MPSTAALPCLFHRDIADCALPPGLPAYWRRPPALATRPSQKGMISLVPSHSLRTTRPKASLVRSDCTARANRRAPHTPIHSTHHACLYALALSPLSPYQSWRQSQQGSPSAGPAEQNLSVHPRLPPPSCSLFYAHLERATRQPFCSVSTTSSLSSWTRIDSNGFIAGLLNCRRRSLLPHTSCFLSFSISVGPASEPLWCRWLCDFFFESTTNGTRPSTIPIRAIILSPTHHQLFACFPERSWRPSISLSRSARPSLPSALRGPAGGFGTSSRSSSSPNELVLAELARSVSPGERAAAA